MDKKITAEEQKQIAEGARLLFGDPDSAINKLIDDAVDPLEEQDTNAE